MVLSLGIEKVIRELIRIIIEAVSMKSVCRFDFSKDNNSNNQS